AEILDEAQSVYVSFTTKLHDVHSVLDKVQSQPARPDFIERPPAPLGHIRRRTAITQDNFQAVLDFLFAPALSGSKVHGDRLVEAINVGKPHNVREAPPDPAKRG